MLISTSGKRHERTFGDRSSYSAYAGTLVRCVGHRPPAHHLGAAPRKFKAEMRRGTHRRLGVPRSVFQRSNQRYWRAKLMVSNDPPLRAVSQLDQATLAEKPSSIGTESVTP